MTKGKLILICQSSGEFITNDDGTLSYEGGEANAVNINQDTSFEDLIIKLAEMSNLDHRTISIKYFLPGNRRNLITLRNDKDLKRMIDFHGHSVTADVFVNGKEGFDRDAIKIHASRYMSEVHLVYQVLPHIYFVVSMSSLVIPASCQPLHTTLEKISLEKFRQTPTLYYTFDSEILNLSVQ